MTRGAAMNAQQWRSRLSLLTADAVRLLTGRCLRAFVDGAVAILLPIYLLQLGYGAFAIGAVITSTQVGSAILTLVVGLVAHRVSLRKLLGGACLLMSATGVAFALAGDYWVILAIAFVGTLNASAGEISVFLPIEQAMLVDTVEARQVTWLFAWYSLAGKLFVALGSLVAALPAAIATYLRIAELMITRSVFALYALFGMLALAVYRGLSPAVERVKQPDKTTSPLGKSKAIVYRLAALFSLDAFGNGFVVQSLLTLWLYQRFHMPVPEVAAILFWSGILSAMSFLVAAPLAERFGLINTMVFTHLPSNILTIMVAFAPNVPIAVALLLARSALSQMDGPMRNSYLMAVVAPEERPAAASVTAAPRTLVGSLSPLLAGYLLALTSFGWPLIIGGALKAAYDILLLISFRRVVPPHEIRGPDAASSTRVGVRQSD